MQESPATRPSLLLRIRDAQDAAGWDEFAQIYAPLIHGFALRHGLQHADAADLTQEVLRCVAGAIGQWDYDPRAGKFRSWLFRVTRNQLINTLLRRRRHPPGSGDTGMLQILEELPAPAEEDEAVWDREYERQLFQWAAAQVRMEFNETHWQAFWRTTVDNYGPADVAAALEMSVGAVYVAKSRVLARLREKIQELGER